MAVLAGPAAIIWDIKTCLLAGKDPDPLFRLGVAIPGYALREDTARHTMKRTGLIRSCDKTYSTGFSGSADSLVYGGCDLFINITPCSKTNGRNVFRLPCWRRRFVPTPGRLSEPGDSTANGS